VLSKALTTMDVVSRPPVNKNRRSPRSQAFFNPTNPTVTKPSCQEQLEDEVPTNKIKCLFKIKIKEHRLNIHVVCCSKNLMRTSHTIKNVSIFCEGRLGLIDEEVNVRQS